LSEQPEAGESSGDQAPDGTSAKAPAKTSRFDRSIVDGPVSGAVWKLAWPTMLQNMIGGLQGIVDHIMVGRYVGFTGNAAIGVSWQIFLVVIVFVASLFAGMGILVARFAGQDDHEKVNRTVYQTFLTSVGLSLFVLAPLGFFLAPSLLNLVNAEPAVVAEALPYLRLLFLFSFGMLIFFMLGGALRAAGDAKTPLRYGIVLTVLNIVLNVIFIRGLGPIPSFGTIGAAMGTILSAWTMAIVALIQLRRDVWVVSFHHLTSWKPDFGIIRQLFKFGLPTGVQGVAMNVAGVMLLRFIGSLERSAEAQAAYTVSYTQLFSLITWTSVGLMGATAAVVGQNLGAKKPERAIEAVHGAARIGLGVALIVGALFVFVPEALLGLFGMTDPVVLGLGLELLRFLSVSGLFITVALTYTGGLQGSGDTKSPLYISIVSQIVIPLGLCFYFQETRGLRATDVWMAILLGHIARAVLSTIVFRQGKWRGIVVEIESQPKGAT